MKIKHKICELPQSEATDIRGLPGSNLKGVMQMAVHFAYSAIQKGDECSEM